MAPEPDVPYYGQTSEFSCGPACVLMTCAAIDRDPFELSRVAEFEVWRRTCLIGLGGTDAFGLSLPYLDRGFELRIFNETYPTIPHDLLTSFLTEEDARLTELSSMMARDELVEAGVEIVERAPRVADVLEGLEQGWIPNCLVGMQEVHEEEIPHWVVACQADEDTVTVHDPYGDDGEAMAVPHQRLQKMLDDIQDLGCSRALVWVRG